MSTDTESVSQETEIHASDYLNKKATQVGFAELIGISQPAVNKHIGRSLVKGHTYRVWLLAYCEHLRNEAAGRGGDDHARLTQSRINESDGKAALNRITYYEKLGDLIQAAEAQRVLIEWADYARREFENCLFSLVHEIETSAGVVVDQALTERIVGPATERVASYAVKLAENLQPGGKDVHIN